MIRKYLQEVIDSLILVNADRIERMVDIISRSERLFIIGSGGSSGNASHAVADFRKICNIEAYNPYDNICELTARTNDEGFDTTITEWLKTSKFESGDCLFILSVGGGKDGVSENIVNALLLAKERDVLIIGIVGRDGGKTKELGDEVVLIPTIDYTTPIVEGLQSVILHGIGSFLHYHWQTPQKKQACL